MGSADGGAAIGVGPALLWLGVIALVCAVPWIVRQVQACTKPAVSAEDEAFDADAALARYMASKATGDVGPAEAEVPPSQFGRKTV